MPTRFRYGSQPDRVRDEIVKAVEAGVLRAAAPVSIAALAERLGISQTPIREALSLLVGARLLVEDRRGGFAVRRIDAHELIGFYRLRLLLVSTALGHAGIEPAAVAPKTISDLMDVIVRAANEPALAELWAHVTLALSPYQRAETEILASAGSAPKSALARVDAGYAEILARLRAHHRQCERRAIAIAAHALR